MLNLNFFNFRLIDAWAAMMNAMTSNAAWGGVRAGTLAVVFVPGALPNGGILRMTGVENLSPAGTSTIDSACRELASTNQLQLQYLANTWAGIRNDQVFDNGGVLASVTEVAAALMAVWRDVIIDKTGATCALPVFSTIASPYGAWNVGCAALCFAATAVDAWPFALNVRNNVGLGQGPSGQNYVSPILGNAALIQSVIDTGAGSAALIPDVDVAINNGSAIFSVMSQAFTFP
jgi:hypothetical protein